MKNNNNNQLREMRDNSAHMTRSVHLHRHDVSTFPLTVLLRYPITSMTRTLSHQWSNRAGDKQSRSKILL